MHVGAERDLRRDLPGWRAARMAKDRSPLTRRWLQHAGDVAEITSVDAAGIGAMLRHRGWLGGKIESRVLVFGSSPLG